ncbi:MAG: hypothetical protein KME26_03075 [Oscillatoria princeps RMCB-10]|nr:hypothetical protein [Oscillatoria princeps RMCB-10]
MSEEATEAAAVTGGGYRAAGERVEMPFSMVVGSPFSCAIRDSQTGTLLFVGSVADPQEHRRLG